jgi:NAD-dependent SIR2 family protein deacetylase
MSTGFFSEALYTSMGYSTSLVENDYADVIGYIRTHFAIDDILGRGRWADLNIEDVFSSIELHREFVSSESDDHAHLTVTRNLLTRYIQGVIGFCTEHSWGEYYREIKNFVCESEDATVITFNWDLLLDREFIDSGNNFLSPYARFEDLLMPSNVIKAGQHLGPLYLKLHGSLNWFKCTNSTCPYNPGILISHYIDDCLRRAEGFHNDGVPRCRRCGSPMTPFIVAPVLKKPVTENSILRTVWGHAIQRLRMATTVIVVGFSAAPSDFYARWLLRSTVGIRDDRDVNIFVVNPANDPKCDQHEEFQRRMAAIFPLGYNEDYRTFSQIRNILVHEAY